MANSRLDLPPLGPIDLDAPIGVGGHAEVVRGVTADGREVAVKRFLRPFENDAQRQRFERECRVLRDLGDVPGVVELLASAVVEGRGHLVTPRYAGTVADRAASLGVLDVDEAVSIARSVAITLDAVHERGVVHRDVKPNNVFLADDGGVVLGDFGVATDFADHTITGAAALSLAYASPEAVAGAPVGSAGDLYGLGATMYHLLAGRPPVDVDRAAGIAGVVHRIAHEAPEPLGRTDVPEALERLVVDLLAKSPGDRPATASIVVARLDALDDPAPVDAAAVPTQRRRTIGVAVAAIVAVAVAGVLWLRNGTDPDLAASASTAVSEPTSVATEPARTSTDLDPTPGPPTTVVPALEPADAAVATASTVPTIGTEPAEVLGTDTIPTTDPPPTTAPAASVPAATTPETTTPGTSAPTTAVQTAPTTTEPDTEATDCAPNALLCESFGAGIDAWFEVADAAVAAVTAPSPLATADRPAVAVVPSGTADAEGGVYLRRTVGVPAGTDSVTVRFFVRFETVGGADWFANVAGVEDARAGVWNVDARPFGERIQLSAFHEVDGEGAFVAATAVEPGAWSCVELVVSPGPASSVALVVDGQRADAPNGIGDETTVSGSISLTVGAKWLSPADAVPAFEVAGLAVHPGDPLGCG